MSPEKLKWQPAYSAGIKLYSQHLSIISSVMVSIIGKTSCIHDISFDYELKLWQAMMKNVASMNGRRAIIIGETSSWRGIGEASRV